MSFSLVLPETVYEYFWLMVSSPYLFTVIPFTIHNTHWRTLRNFNIDRPQFSEMNFSCFQRSTTYCETLLDSIGLRYGFSFTKTHARATEWSRYPSIYYSSSPLLFGECLIRHSEFSVWIRNNSLLPNTNWNQYSVRSLFRNIYMNLCTRSWVEWKNVTDDTRYYILPYLPNKCCQRFSSDSGWGRSGVSWKKKKNDESISIDPRALVDATKCVSLLRGIRH